MVDTIEVAEQTGSVWPRLVEYVSMRYLYDIPHEIVIIYIIEYCRFKGMHCFCVHKHEWMDKSIDRESVRCAKCRTGYSHWQWIPNEFCFVKIAIWRSFSLYFYFSRVTILFDSMRNHFIEDVTKYMWHIHAESSASRANRAADVR